jgi:hypothetical protein
MARANEIIDASSIDNLALKEEIRNQVSLALDTYGFDDALAKLSREAQPSSKATGGTRLLLSRVVNALDTRWLMAQSTRDD